MTNSAVASRGSYSKESLLLEIAQKVTAICGVQFSERHLPMIESNLSRRAQQLGIEAIEDYFDYFRQHKEGESKSLVSLLTTHHTYFFREFSHFEYLLKEGLEKLVNRARAEGRNHLYFWSAACSRGQEAYSLAMFLEVHLPQFAPEMKYSILATDVDPECVEQAQRGIYKAKELESVPMLYLRDHWQRGSGDIAHFVKAKPKLKAHCHFESDNLINIQSPKGRKFDAIFCRNVFIYFSPAQIQQITKDLLSHLVTDGLLFVGISESLHGLKLPIRTLGPSIYVHDQPGAKVTPKPERRVPTTLQEQRPLRVLCVDDSPVVLKLLSKILNRENGFEIVATASNGLEAHKAIRQHQVDVVTLDIHMPQQDGPTYLANNVGADHPPVIMITSVSREDHEIATDCLKKGAFDFVQKPSLNQLQERGEEIRTKLRAAFMAKKNHVDVRLSSLDKEAVTPTSRASVSPAQVSGLQVIVCSPQQRHKLGPLLKSSSARDGLTLVAIDDSSLKHKEWQEWLQKEAGSRVVAFDQQKAPRKRGEITFLGVEATAQTLNLHYKDLPKSILFLHQPSALFAKSFKWVQNRLVILDESLRDSTEAEPKAFANDIVPSTSFAYLTQRFWEKVKK